MANPSSYFWSASSIVVRFMMAAFQRLVSKGTALLGKVQVVMATATGLALSYSLYSALSEGQSLIKKAQSKSSKKSLKKGAVPKILPYPPEEELNRDGLQLRPDEAIYLDLAASARSQACVTSHDKAHALFMWIRVRDDVDPQVVACSVARIQQYVDELEASTDSYCGNYKILAGVGFGPDFYKQVKGGPPQNFSNSRHSLISSNSVGGDILVHAKSNDLDSLKQLSKLILQKMPEDSVLCHEETYGKTRYPDQLPALKEDEGEEEEQEEQEEQEEEGGCTVINFQYTKGQMEMFPPPIPIHPDKPQILFVSDAGTADSPVKRHEAAVDPKTGGSYVMTQRWVHDDELMTSNGDLIMNQWVDKAWEECAGPPGERKFKCEAMLSAEMAEESMEKWFEDAFKECLEMQRKHPDAQIVCTPGHTGPRNPFRILRQSLPYVHQGGDSGLFFVSYASTPRYNEMLLDRLIASACGGGKLNQACQNVFRLSRNVSSACWYFPGLQELRELE